MAEYAIEQARADESDFEEFVPLEIDVLNPERTLVEKLSILHDVAVRYTALDHRAEDAARHLYDVARLVVDAAVRTALEPAPATVAGLAERTDRISKEFGWSFSPRPADGYGASPAFDLAHPIHVVWRPTYDRVLNTLVYGARPKYDECLATVKQYAGLL